MKMTQSIQKRVFLIFGSFTFFLTLVYASMNILLAYVIEDDVLEKVLAYEAKFIESTFKQGGKIIQPRVDYMQLYLQPELAPKEIALAYKNKTLTSEVFSADRNHYHIQFLYFDESNSGLLVAQVTPFLTVSNASKRMVMLFVIIFFIALSLSLWLAYRIANRTTQPISNLAKKVMQQQAQNSTLSLLANQSNDEIGYLAYSIEKALRELKNSIKRESDFNRDVSHELRTPLMVMSNTLSLAEVRALSTQDIQQLNNAVQGMSHIVTTLLTLARAESLALDTFRLRSLLEDCVISLANKCDRKSFKVELDVSADFELAANPQLLTLLINNLIENSLEHSSGDKLIIRLLGQTLSFENEIDQKIISASISNLTEQSFKNENSSGLGQGLYLVKRIVEALEWHFEIKIIAGHFCFNLLMGKPRL